MAKEKLEKITVFCKAWDKRDPDPKKDFGIGSVKCMMVLKGKKGAVHFSFGTGMFLPETLQRLAKEGRLVSHMNHKEFVANEPMGYDVGYHSPKPMFENHDVTWPTKMRKTGDGPLGVVFDKIGKEAPKCDWIGVPCYCDGSALRAEEWMNILIKEGSDKIWSMLEKDYYDTFKK